MLDMTPTSLTSAVASSPGNVLERGEILLQNGIFLIVFSIRSYVDKNIQLFWERCGNKGLKTNNINL